MNTVLEKFKDIHKKILPKLVYILNIEGFTLIFSLIFFISFIIFFFQIEGSEQLKNILSETITYGYTRYFKKDEIKNIKESMFTPDNDTFNEISFYVKKISKLYETYNYKILMKWYNYLHIFYTIMFVFIILDIIYGIHYNSNERNYSNKSKFIKPILLAVLFLMIGIYFILRKKDNDNFKKEFNNIIINADNIKKNIEQSINIPDDKKKELNNTLETLKNNYENYNKPKSNENFINYSNNICYEQNTSSSMLKSLVKFVILFLIIFLVYYSVSLIISITNHINLKNSFNSLLVVVCILAVIEILYFLVVIMKTLKEKISSILKKVNYSLIDEYKSISNKDNKNSNYIIHYILDKNNILPDMINNENINNNQNDYKNDILNKIEKYNNIMDSILQNSSINNEYNINNQNKRVLCVIIILLTMLLIFFYYNNNKKYNVLYRTNNIADIFKMYLTIILNNKYEIFGMGLLLILFIIFISKYQNLKLKEKERVTNIK